MLSGHTHSSAPFRLKVFQVNSFSLPKSLSTSGSSPFALPASPGPQLRTPSQNRLFPPGEEVPAPSQSLHRGIKGISHRRDLCSGGVFSSLTFPPHPIPLHPCFTKPGGAPPRFSDKQNQGERVSKEEGAHYQKLRRRHGLKMSGTGLAGESLLSMHR